MPEIQKIRQLDSYPQLLLKAADCLAVGLGLLFLLWLVPDANSRSTIIVGLVAIGTFNLCAEVIGLYRNWRGITFLHEASCALGAWMLTLFALAAIGRFTDYSTEISSHSLLLWFSISPALSLCFRSGFRYATRWMIRRGIRTRKFAIAGHNELGLQLAESISDSPDLGLEFVGYFDDRGEDRQESGANALGYMAELVQRTRSGEIQVVFITIPMRAEDRIRGFISDLSDTTASVYIVPDLFVFQLLHSRWTEVQGLPVVSVFENPLFGVDGLLKRCVDVFFSGLFLFLASIPMLVIALLVKLDSRGPVFFRQSRYGLDGRRIKVWKFRTMTCCEDGQDIKQATQADQRITSIGMFLRRTSLDELPQLFNVLFGNMSLVGPRPHANAHNEFYRKQIEGYMLRHKVKPGITGLAQVNGCRGETETIDKMQRRIFFDHQYIRNWSIWLDLRILFRTFRVVFNQQNAY